MRRTSYGRAAISIRPSVSSVERSKTVANLNVGTGAVPLSSGATFLHDVSVPFFEDFRHRTVKRDFHSSGLRRGNCLSR